MRRRIFGALAFAFVVHTFAGTKDKRVQTHAMVMGAFGVVTEESGRNKAWTLTAEEQAEQQRQIEIGERTLKREMVGFLLGTRPNIPTFYYTRGGSPAHEARARSHSP